MPNGLIVLLLFDLEVCLYTIIFRHWPTALKHHESEIRDALPNGSGELLWGAWVEGRVKFAKAELHNDFIPWHGTPESAFLQVPCL